MDRQTRYLQLINEGFSTVKKIQNETNHYYKGIQSTTLLMFRQGLIHRELQQLNGKLTAILEITEKGRTVLKNYIPEPTTSIKDFCNPRLYHAYMASLVIRRELDNIV